MPAPHNTQSQRRTNNFLWFLSGVALIACIARLRSISFRFVYGSDMIQRPIITLVLLLMTAALAYFVAVRLAKYTTTSKKRLAWILAVGIILRILFFGSLPMLEDDFYRYLWDGGVTASGHNPYHHTPSDIQARTDTVPEALINLGADSERILTRVNHATLRTLYPPVTQAVFALAHAIQPWSLPTLKAIYFALDLVILALILLQLRHLKIPLLYVALYWWNPLLIKEFYNSAHMDIIALPCVLAALYAHLRNRRYTTMLALALAVGAKLWPIVLAPLFLWPLRHNPKKLIISLLLLTVTTTALLLPMMPTNDAQNDSGLVAYGQRWEMNDALYMIFPATARFFLEHLGGDPTDTLLRQIGRATAGLIVCTVIAGATLRKPQNDHRTATAALAIVATLFLVSPTQFPWYFAWFLPFLTLQPRWSLLLLTLMLPIYYLKFYYEAMNNANFFHYKLVWLEYAPIWALLLFEERNNIARAYKKN